MSAFLWPLLHTHAHTCTCTLPKPRWIMPAIPLDALHSLGRTLNGIKALCHREGNKPQRSLLLAKHFIKMTSRPSPIWPPTQYPCEVRILTKEAKLINFPPNVQSPLSLTPKPSYIFSMPYSQLLHLPLAMPNPLDSSTWNFPQIRRYVELLILPNSGLPFL